MAIYVRNQDGEMEPYKIVGLKGEDGITPNITIGTVTTLEAGQKATVVKEGTKENPIFNFSIPKGADGTGEGNASIDDSTISTEKTWSSSKIEDFVLTNVGAIWKDINGGQMVIDSTMDGFLREVEILGNTTQNQEDLSDIQHLGVWNEAKQGYEIEICVSNSSSKDDLNYQEYRTTIILPCQLMKVGNIADRLYWDYNKGRYVIEKKILRNQINSIYKAPPQEVGAKNYAYYIRFNYKLDLNHENAYSHTYTIPGFKDIIYSYCSANSDPWTFDKWAGYDILIRFPKEDRFSTDQNTLSYLIGNNVCMYCQAKTPELIDTNIREELKLPTYINNTYVTVNGGIQGSIKAKAPVDGGKVIAVLESKNKELEAINNMQDELINTTMLATDEMYSLLEPLFIDMLIDKDISPLLNMYVAMAQRDLKTIEQVPEKYREKVNNIINNK